MSHVFISYKHDDGHFVDPLREKLKAAGIETWVDTDIEPGEVWKAKIDEAIQSSFAVIVVITPESHRSSYVTYEWSYAMGLNIPVMPILLRETEMHPKLVPLQYADFRYGRSDYERLTRKIINLQNAFKPSTKSIENSQEWDVLQIKRVIADLKDPSPVIREAAVLTLGNLQTDMAIDEIFELLRDSRAIVRASALKSLRLIGSKRAIPALIAFINRSDISSLEKYDALITVGHIGGETAKQFLIKSHLAEKVQNFKETPATSAVINHLINNGKGSLGPTIDLSIVGYVTTIFNGVNRQLADIQERITSLEEAKDIFDTEPLHETLTSLRNRTIQFENISRVLDLHSTIEEITNLINTCAYRITSYDKSFGPQEPDW